MQTPTKVDNFVINKSLIPGFFSSNYNNNHHYTAAAAAAAEKTAKTRS